MTGRYVSGILLLAAAGGACLRAARGSLTTARFEGLLLGLALATVGAVSWILLASWTIGRGQGTFLAAQALGMVGRLVIYGGALVYVASRTKIDPVGLAGSLLGFHVIYLMLEVRFAAKGLRRSGTGAPGEGRHVG